MFEDFRLRVFLTVAEKGSFTKAAKFLGVSQPAVSQNIAELEKSVGRELFNRNRSSVALTPSGIAFKEYAERILYWYTSAEKMFGQTGRLTAGRQIRIAADSTIADYVLPDILAKLLVSSETVSFLVTGLDSSEKADITIVGKPHTSELRLDEGMDFAVEIPAVAISSDPEYSKILRLTDLPGNVRLAALQAYSETLDPDILARTAVISASAAGIIRLVKGNPDIIGIVPLAAAPSDLHKLSIPLPRLATDFYLRPSAAFASDPVLSVIKRLFAEL